jgi:hypothetical protein
MKRTAVDYLKEATCAKFAQVQMEGDREDEFCIELSELKLIIDQANRVFEEQIMEAWYDCKMSVILKDPTTADQYYNKTFKRNR